MILNEKADVLFFIIFQNKTSTFTFNMVDNINCMTTYRVFKYRLIARKPPLFARPSSGVYRTTGGYESCRVNNIKDR